ncbi:MAG: O-antigen ligase family protein [Pseudomonadota bacterium]
MTATELRRDRRWTPIAFALTLSYLVLLPGEPWFNYPLMLMAILAIVVAVRDWSNVHRSRAVRAAAVVLVLLWVPIVIAQLDAVDPDAAWGRLVRFPIYYGAAVFVLVTLSPQHLQRIVHVTGAVILIWSLDACLQYWVGRNVLGWPHDSGRLTGIFYPKYTLGPVLATLAPIYYAVVGEWARRSPIFLLALLPFWSAIGLNASRTSWVLLLLGSLAYVVLWAITRPDPIKRRWIGGVTGAMAVVVLVGGFALHHASPEALGPVPQRLATFRALLSGDAQAVDRATGRRLTVWTTAWRIAKDHWANGVGSRNFRVVYTAYADPDDYFLVKNNGQPPTHPHQLGLEVLVDTGALGLGCYVLLLALFVRWFSRALRAPSWETVGVGLTLILAYFPLSMHKSFYGNIWSSFAWWLMIIAIGSFFLNHQPSGSRPRRDRSTATIASDSPHYV